LAGQVLLTSVLARIHDALDVGGPSAVRAPDVLDLENQAGQDVPLSPTR
jgi:hypothetical protein